MNLYEKYLLTDAKEKEKSGKECFHCKNAPAMPKRSVCQKCSSELEAWRNKKNKKESEK